MKLKYLKHSPKSVALVCMGPSVCDYLNNTLTQEYTDEFCDEVWVINMSVNCFKADVCFWMDDLRQQRDFKPGLLRALDKSGVPVITSVRRPDVVKNSYDYPLQEICTMPVVPEGVSPDGKTIIDSQSVVELFGRPYLNNGVAMAIAYALYKGVQVLKIYGADFSYPNRDYAESGRACVEVWMTVAMMNRMTIALCPNTSLMDVVKDHGIYGYSEQPSVTLKNGVVFRYQKIEDTDMGKYAQVAPHQKDVVAAGGSGYVPEDSSGAPKTNASVPVQPAGAPRRVGETPAPDAPVAARRPRKSVRHRNSVGRAKERDPAHAGGSAEYGTPVGQA